MELYWNIVYKESICSQLDWTTKPRFSKQNQQQQKTMQKTTALDKKYKKRKQKKQNKK